MSTNHVTIGKIRLKLSIHPIGAVLKQYWRAFHEERRRRQLRTALYSLNDHDLRDIGISRDMIEHIVLESDRRPTLCRTGQLGDWLKIIGSVAVVRLWHFCDIPAHLRMSVHRGPEVAVIRPTDAKDPKKTLV